MEAETTPRNDSLSRAGLYEFFSRVLLIELDVETIRVYQDEELRETLKSLGIIVPAEADDDTVEDLAIDYCKILIGPKDFCPPFQSVWESGHMQSYVVDSMDEYLQVVQPVSDQSIKDHAGLQMELMSLILRYEADHDGQSEGLAQSFYRNHIAWMDKLFRRAAGLADTDFYKTVFQSAAKFIALESEYFV